MKTLMRPTLKVNDWARVLAVKAYKRLEAKKIYGDSSETAYVIGKVFGRANRSVEIELTCGKLLNIGARAVEKLDASAGPYSP